MSLTCELSGEPLASTQEEVVVTPSGHVCIKHLLLAKLAENGGMDPFEPIRERPLSEDQLITLQKNSKQVPPPRPQATSLPNMLQLVQTEYDALVLELFDTRKALEDTRRELSQALYQNDAAVRVVARLAMERDTARQELERWNASVGAAPTTPAVADAADAADVDADAAAAEDKVEEPQSKRRRIESTEPLKNDLPEEDLTAMVDTWQKLHPQRKPMLKAAAAAAPSPKDLAEYSKVDNKAWHKSTCRNVLCMAASGDLIVTAGKDKQVVVYHAEDKVVKHTFSFGSIATCVDVHQTMLVAGDAKGRVVVYSAEDGSTLGDLKIESASIVDVRIHPTTKHICVATSDGRLLVCSVEDNKLQQLAHFENEESTEYCCGALHPDGLLYAAGTSTGQVQMWDFKNKVLASTLQVSFGVV
jgi:pre-mRNA-processing factor 19